MAGEQVEQILVLSSETSDEIAFPMASRKAKREVGWTSGMPWGRQFRMEPCIFRLFLNLVTLSTEWFDRGQSMSSILRPFTGPFSPIELLPVTNWKGGKMYFPLELRARKKNVLSFLA